ncbi:uncharacterized protein LOC126747570 [Anthonomus grandis grandis]|uniref:uncharacterized protein LOC126747570 n=1 Tax=Anthonomus grandis grandis TaxID=2921223 RepID=UPI0021651407|nr:uncharacterized protein LOC126747570 [Anthonomus grandis grandis]
MRFSTCVALAILLIFEKIRHTKSLKGMKLTIPRAVREGHSATLDCQYDLQGAQLYSVKWYRENDEFYRYVPKEEPPTRVFTIQGIHVDVSVSDANKVTLLSVGRDISGLFQCEVSADAPSFHTDVRSAPMTVAVVPVGIPLVTVDKTGLEHGRPLIADCHVPPSHPASNVTFFVNDEKVPGYTSEQITPLADQSLEQKTARLELSGVGGSWEPLRITCEASLFKLYRARSLEVQVKPDTPHPASVLLMGERNSSGARTNLMLMPPSRLVSLGVFLVKVFF